MKILLGPAAAWCGIGLSVTSSIGYFWNGDIRRGLYYVFAALITAVVVWP